MHRGLQTGLLLSSPRAPCTSWTTQWFLQVSADGDPSIGESLSDAGTFKSHMCSWAVHMVFSSASPVQRDRGPRMPENHLCSWAVHADFRAPGMLVLWDQSPWSQGTLCNRDARNLCAAQLYMQLLKIWDTVSPWSKKSRSVSDSWSTPNCFWWLGGEPVLLPTQVGRGQLCPAP